MKCRPEISGLNYTFFNISLQSASFFVYYFVAIFYFKLLYSTNTILIFT